MNKDGVPDCWLAGRGKGMDLQYLPQHVIEQIIIAVARISESGDLNWAKSSEK